MPLADVSVFGGFWDGAGVLFDFVPERHQVSPLFLYSFHIPLVGTFAFPCFLNYIVGTWARECIRWDLVAIMGKEDTAVRSCWIFGGS